MADVCSRSRKPSGRGVVLRALHLSVVWSPVRGYGMNIIYYMYVCSLSVFDNAGDDDETPWVRLLIIMMMDNIIITTPPPAGPISFVCLIFPLEKKTIHILHSYDIQHVVVITGNTQQQQQQFIEPSPRLNTSHACMHACDFRKNYGLLL